jgi:hypothetical protein
MSNVPTPEFQNFWSKQIESLRSEYGKVIRQHPDAEGVMERINGVLIAIARLAGCTPASVGESPKWNLIVQNMADTTRSLSQALKGKQLYSALYAVYTDVLHNLIAVLEESADRAQSITAPPSIKTFRGQRGRKRKLTDDTNKRAKKPATSTTGVNGPQLRSKNRAPTRNFFAPSVSTERQADHGDDADGTTGGQQQQAPSSQAGRPPHIVLISQVNQIHLQRQLRVL